MADGLEKERLEAIAAGRDALNRLYQAQECLDSAGNWGVYDILGGGMISSLIKHDRMDEAQEHIFRAQNSLRRFEKELRDLDNLDTINLDTQDFLGIADVIFDGLFADIAMQNRINEARDEVSWAIRQVNGILKKLSENGGI